MKWGELLEVTKYSSVELHSSYDGKLIATARETLKLYDDVTVLSIYPKMKLNAAGDVSRLYLYVYGNYEDICDTRRKGVV